MDTSISELPAALLVMVEVSAVQMQWHKYFRDLFVFPVSFLSFVTELL
jgi:hypothetical protein